MSKMSKTAIMYDFLMYRNALSTTDVVSTISYLASVLPLYLFSGYFKIVSIAVLAIYLKYLSILPILLSLSLLLRVARPALTAVICYPTLPMISHYLD